MTASPASPWAMACGCHGATPRSRASSLYLATAVVSREGSVMRPATSTATASWRCAPSSTGRQPRRWPGWTCLADAEKAVCDSCGDRMEDALLRNGLETELRRLGITRETAAEPPRPRASRAVPADPRETASPPAAASRPERTPAAAGHLHRHLRHPAAAPVPAQRAAPDVIYAASQLWTIN
jgi:hypothetical protein